MAKTDFFKVYGATERQDQVVKISATNYLLIYGYGTDSEDSEQGYNWRKYYDHKPTESELKADIETLINGITDGNILNGFTWNGKPVYLSTENQMNFKAAYDLAVQTEGETLPLKMKLGEDEDGNAVYHTFTALSAFTDFYTKAVAYIQAALQEGWTEKDGIDYSTLLADE